MRTFPPTLLIVLSILSATSTGYAQSVDATLVGTVLDQQGAPLPGTTVSATAPTTGIVRSAVADAEGRFVIRSIPANTYEVRAELDGFEPGVRESEPIYVGTTVTANFTLAVAGVAETVAVHGTLPILETTKNTLARTVQMDEIDSLPVINRNFNDLAALAPGVTKTGVLGGVDISGSRDFQNGYQLDGVSAERQHLGDQRTAYAQDWVQEFQVLTSQFNAEFGQAAGGILNVVTRSGANRPSARAYGYLRNEAWDALPEFATTKPPLDERRLGVTTGGPIVRNRLFYFGGVEHLHTLSSNIVNSTFPSANGVVPAKDERLLSLLKLDGSSGAAHTYRLRFNAQRQRATGAAVGGISTEEHGRFTDTHGDDVVAGWNWIAASSTMNEMRGAWSRIAPEGGCNFATRNPLGTWFERSYPGAQFGCPVNFGTIAEKQAQFIDNVLWMRARHEFKLGAQAYSTESHGDFRNFRDGRYSFERDVPFTLADPNSYPFSFSLIEGPTAWRVSGWSFGTFVQDNWRIANGFSLNAGVRYDIDSSLTALNPLVRLDQGLHPIDSDLDNVAPRVGLAWTPFHDEQRTLLRAGVGFYYDQNHNNVTSALLLNNILVDRIVTLNANSSLLNPFWPDVTRAKAFLASALANNTIPDVAALGPIAGSTNDVDQGLEVPGTTQVSAGIAHEFASRLSASADVVVARGVDLYVIRNTNVDPVSLQRLNPNYSSISAFGNGGTSRYRGLHVQATIPGSGYFVKIAYSLATSRSNTNSTLSTGAATNPFDYSEDEGPADNDVRHNLALNGSSLLPLGIQVSGIVSFRTALPYSATTSAPRPDGKPFAFRPEPRNARRGDSAFSADLRIAKVLALGSSRSVSVFTELFNVTNAVNYSGYIGTITSSRFGEPTTAAPNRRVQLGFRLEL